MGVLGGRPQLYTGKVQGLASLLDHYGKEILWDFQAELGIDIHDYACGLRGYKEFYVFLNQLPPHSKFKSAVSQNPEIAELEISSLSDNDIREIMEQREEGKPGRQTPEGYTLEIEKLNQLIDEIKILRIAMSGSKKTKFVPAQRPETEAEALLNKRIEILEEEDRNTFEKELGF